MLCTKVYIYIFAVTECKKRWATLRDSYRKALKAGKGRSGDPAKKKRRWRYELQMGFLRPFMANRKQISNIKDTDTEEFENESNFPEEEYTADFQDTESIESIENVLSPEPESSGTTSSTSKLAPKKKAISAKFSAKSKPIRAAEVLQSYLSQKKPVESVSKGDHLTKFFESIEETVRTFTPELQIDVKSKIFNIVNEAEIQNIARIKQMETAYPTFNPAHLQSASNMNQHYHGAPAAVTQFPSALQNSSWAPHFYPSPNTESSGGRHHFEQQQTTPPAPQTAHAVTPTHTIL